MDATELFSYCEDRILRDPESDCWLWTGPTNKEYGVVNWKGKKYRAHRVVSALYGRFIPHELLALHSCDTPGCVNPEHISEGTQLVNMEQAAERERTSRGSKRYNAKISDNDVRKIRQSDASHRELARLYSMDESTIRAIRTRKRWKHVD